MWHDLLQLENVSTDHPCCRSAQGEHTEAAHYLALVS